MCNHDHNDEVIDVMKPWCLDGEVVSRIGSCDCKRIAVFLGYQSMDHYLWNGIAECLALLLTNLCAFSPTCDLLVITNGVDINDNEVMEFLSRQEVQVIYNGVGCDLHGKDTHYSEKDFVFEHAMQDVYEHRIWKYAGAREKVDGRLYDLYQDMAVLTCELDLICEASCCITSSWGACGKDDRKRPVIYAKKMFDMFTTGQLGTFPITDTRLEQIVQAIANLPEYLKLFTASSFSIAFTEPNSEYAKQLRRMRRRLVDAKKIWRHCMKHMTPVPLDLREFNCMMCKGAGKWSQEAMDEIADSLGVKELIYGLSQNIPYDDLITGAAHANI